MDMDTNGFYGDTFNNGFGSFETVKRAPSMYRWERLEMGFFFYFQN